MLRDTEEIDKLKSDEFKGLKKDKEELLPGSYNYDAIKGVQSFLNKEGYTDKKGDMLKTDGIYGANTANAVMKYQRANGLSVDGIVGDETWNSIYGKKKKEENTFGKNPFDVWKRGYNPLVGNKTEDGEDLHERVRKGWESRTLPERYMAKTESPQKAERFANDFAMDYSAFEEKDFPDYELFSNSASGKKTSTESKDAGTQRITVTEADRNIINDGMGRKAGTAFSKPDSQNVVGTDYRSYYDFDETPAKTVLSGELNDALEIAITNKDYTSEQVIKTTIANVESFDDSAITGVYYLNDEDGAMTAGHSGILMVNSDGQGILFSFYPQIQKFPDGVFYSQSEMRISVLGGQGLENFLNGSPVLSASTSGKKRTESYDRVLEYEISPEQGKAMFEQAVAIAGLGFSYDLAYRNCDHVALSILRMGGITVTKEVLPNESFTGVGEF